MAIHLWLCRVMLWSVILSGCSAAEELRTAGLVVAALLLPCDDQASARRQEKRPGRHGMNNVYGVKGTARQNNGWVTGCAVGGCVCHWTTVLYAALPSWFAPCNGFVPRAVPAFSAASLPCATASSSCGTAASIPPPLPAGATCACLRRYLR
jgi:hypothetical protein